MKHRQPSGGRHRTDALGRAHGRHRAQESLFANGRHRAPVELAERGRQVAALAVIATGVGIAAASATPDPAPAVATNIAIDSRAAIAASADRAVRPAPVVAAPTGTGTPIALPQKKAVNTKAENAKAVNTKAEVKAVAEWVEPMPGARTTSCFGQRWGRLHAGVDLAVAPGTPIRSVGAGTVVSAGANFGGYGISVLVDHGNGYLTHYAHMSAKSVSVGDRVTAGQVLGKEGSTGHVTGPHLHFEVHKGSFQNPVEPTAWLADRGVRIRGC